jgi:phosphoglucosamine mutase
VVDPLRFPRFGTDGVRGVANVDLTPDVAIALARAASGVLAPSKSVEDSVRRVVIGRDTRRSGLMIEAALVAGYTASGIDVELMGVVPTPAVAHAAAACGSQGVMISASHNPYVDNGIKLFAPGGLKLDDATEHAIEDAFHDYLRRSSDPPAALGAEIGVVETSHAAEGWMEAVVTSAGGRIFAGRSIVLDCAHGAASELGPRVFRALGASVTVMGASPDGMNINADSGSTHPRALQQRVVAEQADLGLAFDGDADRLIAVDESGQLVDGDHILGILAKDWKATGDLHADTVVVTVMTNLGFRLAMAEHGINVVSTQVGDRYVLEALNAGSDGRRFSLGGEQSGHVICRDLASTGDGVLAGVQLLVAMDRAGTGLHELARTTMTTYPQVLRNVRLARREPDVAEKLADAVAAAEAELGDQGRVLVRPSGTEPLVRVMVEHLDAAVADRVCDELVGIAVERVGVDP